MENLQKQEEELQYLCNDLTRASRRAPPHGFDDGKHRVRYHLRACLRQYEQLTRMT